MNTIINAGFSRCNRERKRREWKNIQNMTINLPEDQFDSLLFRNAIREQMPEWTLEGYCLRGDDTKVIDVLGTVGVL